jgi:hypothetical protein
MPYAYAPYPVSPPVFYGTQYSPPFLVQASDGTLYFAPVPYPLQTWASPRLCPPRDFSTPRTVVLTSLPLSATPVVAEAALRVTRGGAF